MSNDVDIKAFVDRLPEATLNALGFANFCLEYETITPNLKDYHDYVEQGGYDYYRKHIEDAILSSFNE